MVSALRQRASRQAASPDTAGAGGLPVVDDAVESPARRPGKVRPRRDGRAPRLAALARRFGLAVSIAAGMVASAIGGALVAHSRSAVSLAPPPALMAEPAALPASAPAAQPDAASAVHAPVEVASTAAPLPASAAAASAAHPVEAMPGESGPSASASAAAAHAHAATAWAASAAVPAEDLTFGLDINGDSIPDALERYVRKTIGTPATRVAARHYYRVALPLATRAQQGDVIAHADKQAVFRAAECYLLTAAEDDVPDPPNLNDRAILIGVAAADRMQALAESLAGFDYRLAGARRSACG